MRIGVFSLALIILLPATMQGQDPRLRGRLDSMTLARVTAFIDSTGEHGIPGEALVQKALEGSSKGASGDRILAAVRNLAAFLATARSALGPASSERELVAGAAALRAGAQPEALQGLRRVRGTGPLDVPLAVLADLVGLGMNVTSAYESVLDLARHQAPDEEYIRLKQRQIEDSRP